MNSKFNKFHYPFEEKQLTKYSVKNYGCFYDCEPKNKSRYICDNK